MKKWHLESIINFPNTNRKMAVPNSHQVHYWSANLTLEPKREFLFIPICRSVIAFFVKFF